MQGLLEGCEKKLYREWAKNVLQDNIKSGLLRIVSAGMSHEMLLYSQADDHFLSVSVLHCVVIG